MAAAEPVSLAVCSRVAVLSSSLLSISTGEFTASDVLPPAPINTSADVLVRSVLLSSKLKS